MRLSAPKSRSSAAAGGCSPACRFSVGAGEALIVTGPNGAGKSSLLRAIAGLPAARGGKPRSEGGDAEASLGEQAHYLGHADALKGALTAGENLAFWAGDARHGDPRRGAWSPRALERARPRPCRRFSGRRALGGPEAARRAGAASCRAAAALAARRADDRARRRRAEPASPKSCARIWPAGGLIVAATHAPLGLARRRS